MNQTLRFCHTGDTQLSQGARVAPVVVGTFTGNGFTSDRLRAFASRFAPSKETFVQRVSSLAVTAGIYVGIVAVAWELSTANVLPLLHALHLNGV